MKFFRIVYSLFLALHLQEGSCGAEDFEAIEKTMNYTIWAKPSQGLRSVSPQFRTALNEFISSGLLKTRLPYSFGILIDSELKASLGFHSPTLKAPDQTAAIILHPDAVSHARHYRTLLHELIHLAHENIRPHEESWLREGLALMGEQSILQKINPIFREGFLNPETSLVGDLNLTADSPERELLIKAQYGHLALFFSYAFKHCGKTELLEKLLFGDSDKQGIALIDSVLANSKDSHPVFCESFSSLFRKFEYVRFTQNPSSEDSFVVITTVETPIRKERRSLLPYSASIYSEPDSGCEVGDQKIRDRVCLEIRER